MLPTAALPAPPPRLVEETGEGGFRLHLHPGQERAWDAAERFILVLAGTQGGKTEFGPWWLHREIQERGPGDYLAVAPTYPLMSKKQLPAFLRLFEDRLDLGRFKGGNSNRFVFSRQGEIATFGAEQVEPTQIFFGHAQDPDSLEAATAKAAWLDEPGQKKFRVGSWEAILRRLAIHLGRVLLTTTPYDLGWLKTEIHDRWRRRGTPGEQPEDRDYRVVGFESIENPAFPRAEFERAKRTLPKWKFDMFYRGRFTQPAGLIYDCFDPEAHKAKRFDVPEGWKRYLGIDFGGVSTAATFWAEEPGTKRLYCYREYLAGGRTAADHAKALLAGEPGVPSRVVGGSKSEGQWRREFAAAGLPVHEPDQPDVEVGIQRVYGLFKEDLGRVMDCCTGLLDQFGSYSRPVDETGNPQEGIEDKELYHYLDSARYIVGWLRRKTGGLFIGRIA
jgi:hypothetical protein